MSISKFLNGLNCFRRDDSGATAIEYGLFAALVGAVIVGSVASLGGTVNDGFVKVDCQLTDPASTTC